MGSSTTERPGDGESSPVGDNTYSSDDANATDLLKPDAPSVEKVACGRCRRRKIKCDRIRPCSQCIRGHAQCSYPAVQKRVKRQRILISSLYESRIEHISQKIDHLARLMEGSDGPGEKGPSQVLGNRKETYYPVKDNGPSQPSAAEHPSIDSALFAHAISATEFVEEAVRAENGKGAANTAAEMRSALGTLQAVVNAQRRRNVAEKDAPPFPDATPFNKATRDGLPAPPLDKVMACLRMVQDCAQRTVPISWFGELKLFCDFTFYLGKACSPGPVTDSELIITYAGLYWLFAECAMMTSDDSKPDLNRQAQIFQSGLEAILSKLDFHSPVTVDYVVAMYLATLYSFQKGKILACWTFISTASLHAQALGLHNNASMAGDTVEERRRKTCLFWHVYSLERVVSLRLMRPSTIRDDYITVPKPEVQPSTVVTFRQSLLDSVNAARIFGLLFDNIYSPRALAQPAEIRATRIDAFAAEWLEVSTSKAENLAKLATRSEGLRNSTMVELVRHSTKASDYVVLTAIERAKFIHAPAAITAECALAAREALRGHTDCITLLLETELDSPLLELWVNGALMLLPFFPFNIVFCNVVETANLDGLNTLRDLVQAMELLSKRPSYASCVTQLGVFRALYNMAASYVSAKGKADDGAFNNIAPSHVRSFGAYEGFQSGVESLIDGESRGDGLQPPSMFQALESHTWAGLGGMELDPLDMQLGSWF